MKKMDSRCPRRLTNYPEEWCPLAVQRLKALRHAGRELTEEEEMRLPGCEWACNHQMANYCFFKLIDQHLPSRRQLSDVEVAHYCSISTDTVHKVELQALNKLRSSDDMKELMPSNGENSIFDEF